MKQQIANNGRINQVANTNIDEVNLKNDVNNTARAANTNITAAGALNNS